MDRDRPETARNAIVVGGGAAGLVAALALRAAGAEVAVIAPPRAADSRTTALMEGSVAALDALGVWQALRPKASPLRTLRLVDATRRLLRAPEVTFRSAEIGKEAFAWNVENADLLAALEDALSACGGVERVTGKVLSVEPGEDAADVVLEDGGRRRAALVAAADGRGSAVRAALGIGMRMHAYPQVAVTATLAHERPHGDISTELHTETGPFTLVPLPGQRSSVVCVVSPAEAGELTALDAAGFALAMEKRAHSILGRMRLESAAAAFPLGTGTAERFGAARGALLGEAAHVLPPIGAQGYNLGLRDAATLAELVADAWRRGADIGSAELGAEYDRRRRADVESRAVAADLLNRSLLSELVPVHGLRGLGLWALGRSPALRRAAMRQGLGPARHAPRLTEGRPL